MNQGKQTFVATFLRAQAVLVGIPFAFFALTAVLMWLSQLLAKIFPSAEEILMLPAMSALMVAIFGGALYQLPVGVLFPGHFKSESFVASPKGALGWVILVVSYTVVALTFAVVVTLRRRLWPILDVRTRRTVNLVCGGVVASLVLAGCAYLFICANATEAQRSGGWVKYSRGYIANEVQMIWWRTIHDPRSVLFLIGAACVLLWLVYDARRRKRSKQGAEGDG